MKTEERAKKIQIIATTLSLIFGAVSGFFGMFQAKEAINLKNEVTNLQNASQQTIVNVISTLGDDAQTGDLAQSGDAVAVTDQLINVYSDLSCRHALSPGRFFSRCIRTFLYSGPISPSRSRKVRKVNAGLSPMGVFLNCVYFWLIACAEIAIAKIILALTSPACRVELNSRHSTVPW